jgi:diguanylate cyclase (GGDEF)-like protein
LQTLIGTIAETLATAQATTAQPVAQDVMRMLVEHLDVDVAFLRFNDHDRRITTAYAEWPPRFAHSADDPLGTIYFEGAGPVFAAQEHQKELRELRGELAEPDYQRLVEQAHGRTTATVVTVPVLTATRVTAGVLGFASYEPHDWNDDEIAMLTTVAALIALFHARIVAEQARYRDELTRLPDRQALRDDLGRRLSSGSSAAAVTALMIEFTDTTMIRDRLGHEAHDEFFVEAAERLRTALAGSAGVYRAGAEEFVVLPLDAGATAARRLAEHLRIVLEAPMPVHGDLLVPSVSIGIASAFPDVDAPDDLIRRLVQAARHAQSQQHDRISVLNRTIARTAGRRHELELGIRNAIDDGSIKVHYQPEVDLRTRTIVGMEALVRWQHPTLGELLPETFLDVVESRNLSDALGRRVLTTACADLAAWRADGLALDAVMRVNVSPRQLVDPAFPDAVAEIVADSRIAPGAVCFEFTEHVMLHDLLDVRSLVERLKGIGFGVAIDDFGTGYSGFTQLRHLPLDAVKIDRTFVRDLDTNRYDRAIAAAVTSLADAFDIDVIAEGVETDAVAAVLLELGCTLAQGFLFAPGVPADEMRRLLADQAARQAGIA